MQYVKLAEFTPDTDTQPVTLALERAGIPFQLVEEKGLLVLYVDSDAHIGDVVELVRAATEDIQHRQEDIGLRPMPSFKQQFQRTPLVITFLVLSIAGALLGIPRLEIMHWFTFQDFETMTDGRVNLYSFGETMSRWQVWRLLTPIFLHFHWLHILFNGLWLWELGRRVETFAGSKHFFIVVFLTGSISNFSQFRFEHSPIFGGFSGVIYGLIGYIWIRNTIAPVAVFNLPKGIIYFMLGWLFFCMSGAVTFLFGVNIANAAHISGLLAGMLLGLVFGLGARNAHSS